jgi:5'-nucleotidase
MCLLNINVPNVSEEEISGVQFTFAGYQNYTEEVVKRSDTRGKDYYWVGGTYKGPEHIPGSDGNAIVANFISVDLQSFSTIEEGLVSPLREFIENLE